MSQVTISEYNLKEIADGFKSTSEVLERVARRFTDADRDVTLGSLQRDQQRLSNDIERLESIITHKDGLLVKTTELTGQVISLATELRTLATTTNSVISKIENQIATIVKTDKDVALEEKKLRAMMRVQWLTMITGIICALLTLIGVIYVANHSIPHP